MAKIIKYNRNGIKKANTEQPVPVGTITAFAGSTAPGGWFLCQGQELSKTEYPILSVICGTSYGSNTNGSGGAGTSHFRLPDLRGRIPIGSGTGAGNGSSGTGATTGTALTARTLGSTVGSATITLSSTESGSPAHNHGVSQTNHGHTITDTAHAHNIGYSTINLLNTGPATAVPDAFYRASYNMVSSSAGWSNSSSTSGITVNNNNGESATSAHSNTQPVLVVSYIIKAV